MRCRPLLLAALLPLACAGTRADPGYYVAVPYVQPGKATLDFRYWTVNPDGRFEIIWPELGVGWGVNSRWSTELFVSWIGSPQIPTQVSTVNWQNSVLITQGGQSYDLALHLQLISDRRDPGRWGLEYGTLWQTDIGRTQLNANLIFERWWGAATQAPTRLKYQWQLRHRLFKRWHLGAQGFGELGPWDDWLTNNRQSHRAGPAVFGTVRLGDDQALKMQLAWLRGKTHGRPGEMTTLRVHYDF